MTKSSDVSLKDNPDLKELANEARRNALLGWLICPKVGWMLHVVHWVPKIAILFHLEFHSQQVHLLFEPLRKA
jgi:hypothetical protein